MIYRYKCHHCDNIFDLVREVKDRDNKIECPKCESKTVTRLINSNFGISFKGSGFACNDK
jgi:putative FmdB family regulatory protein